jgi:hypothetical protein
MPNTISNTIMVMENPVLYLANQGNKGAKLANTLVKPSKVWPTSKASAWALCSARHLKFC